MARPEGIYAQLSMTLSEFTRDLDDITAKNVSMAAKQCKRDIKANAPKSTGGYIKGWTVRTKRKKHEVEAVVYNRDFPGLTHLLEESHIVRNQFGKYERTDPEHGRGGKVHIRPAEEKATEYLIQLMVDSLE